MDMDLEQQLTAALEGRASGVPVAPADLGAVRSRARSIRRRRAAGGAVAGAAVVALVVPVAMGLGGLRSASEAPPVGPAPATSTPSVPAKVCSSTGVAKPTLPAGLPPAVATTWQQIVDAAAACDLSALEALGADAITSYGDKQGITNLRRWEREGDGKLGVLLKVMATTSGVGPDLGGVRFYGWPALSVRHTWSPLTSAERAELETFQKPSEVASFEEMQMYYGWRVGIRSDGTWLYFVAGD
ncbi:hypothetical protein [Nocardioides jejuensis]|uniref:Uncharacterized protein n=1 Tax=Nocardioides jejuensis TaxID=2502782 RepID=A0A4R1C1N1_9ACTN|nr:hypothetical protein [Nocardioides jejuensis]TCJ24374.1 hypothetical protein EPD65_09180 [Nocardioides jejuensis]